MVGCGPGARLRGRAGLGRGEPAARRAGRAGLRLRHRRSGRAGRSHLPRAEPRQRHAAHRPREELVRLHGRRPLGARGPAGRRGARRGELHPARLAGRATKAIKVYPNDPDPPLAGLPPQVTFGVTRGGATPERELYIRNRGQRPVTVTRVTVPDEVVTYTLTAVQEGQEYRLTLRLRDGLKPGKVESKVEIFTDHPEEKRLVIPLYAIVRDGRRG